MRFIYTKTFVRVFTIFIILALLVIFDARGYLGFGKDGFFRVYGFATNRLAAATKNVKVTLATFFTLKNLATDNAKLSLEVDQLAFENARLKSAQNENAALRRALNFSQQSNFKLMPVETLVVDPTGFSQTIILNKGENSGVKPGQPVIAQPGLLVGKITKVYPESAEATLITDPGVVLNGEVADTAARGLIRGEHGLGLSFDLITQNELIKTGDLVITSGLSNDFPRGILIGSINSIRSTSTDLFQKAFVAPAADLRNIRFLFIIQ
jgi:rod shape-determining protein MreC